MMSQPPKNPAKIIQYEPEKKIKFSKEKDAQIAQFVYADKPYGLEFDCHSEDEEFRKTYGPSYHSYIIGKNGIKEGGFKEKCAAKFLKLEAIVNALHPKEEREMFEDVLFDDKGKVAGFLPACIVRLNSGKNCFICYDEQLDSISNCLLKTTYDDIMTFLNSSEIENKINENPLKVDVFESAKGFLPNKDQYEMKVNSKGEIVRKDVVLTADVLRYVVKTVHDLKVHANIDSFEFFAEPIATSLNDLTTKKDDFAKNGKAMSMDDILLYIQDTLKRFQFAEERQILTVCVPAIYKKDVEKYKNFTPQASGSNSENTYEGLSEHIYQEPREYEQLTSPAQAYIKKDGERASHSWNPSKLNQPDYSNLNQATKSADNQRIYTNTSIIQQSSNDDYGDFERKREERLKRLEDDRRRAQLLRYEEERSANNARQYRLGNDIVSNAIRSDFADSHRAHSVEKTEEFRSEKSKGLGTCGALKKGSPKGKEEGKKGFFSRFR